MKDSPYITWAKHHHGLTCNLASSGVADPPVELIGFQREDLNVSGEHVEGWPPLLERIAGRYRVSGAWWTCSTCSCPILPSAWRRVPWIARGSS